MPAKNKKYKNSAIKNVLIVSPFFPPLNTIAALRFGEMIPYMEELGWRSWVITTNSSGPVSVGLNQSRIFRIGTLSQKTSYVNVNADCKRLNFSLRTIRNFLGLFNIRFRTLDSSVLKWYRQVLHEYNSIRKALPRIDVVIGSYGPPASLWLTRHLSSKYQIPSIVDFRDLCALHNVGRNKIAQVLDRAIERLLVKFTKAFITVSPTLSQILSETYGKPTVTIYNGWNPASQLDFNQTDPNSCNEAKLSFKRPYLYYAGRFYLHQMKSMYLVLKAIARKPNVRLIIRSLGPPELEHKIRTEVVALGINDYVTILSPCEPKQISFESHYAAANLVVEKLDEDDVVSRGTLTGKLLQLIAQAPVVLVVARKDSDIGEILRITEKGRLCSSVDEISDFIDSLNVAASVFKGNLEGIRQFSRKQQAAKLCSILNDVVSDNLGDHQIVSC